ncbi:MAG: GH3 auxin-responsive promoter family protein, partial [Cytophagales bacterium]
NYSCHEWFIEFINPPEDIFSFSNSIEKKLKFLNPYYSNLINFKILNNLKIVSLKKNSFISYMKFNNKLGGQNKVPKLCNDRIIANDLLKYKL